MNGVGAVELDVELDGLLFWLNDNAWGDILRSGGPPLAEEILTGLVCGFTGIPSSFGILSMMMMHTNRNMQRGQQVTHARRRLDLTLVRFQQKRMITTEISI